tara:strand:+ start:34 stop:519 length:486 start_codon:yes stop_codon:yes gene_type:complete
MIRNLQLQKFLRDYNIEIIQEGSKLDESKLIVIFDEFNKFIRITHNNFFHNDMVMLNIKPLSVNEAWQGKRYKSKKYTAYQKETLLSLPNLKQGFDGELKAKIMYGFSSKSSDIDNPCKLILDILSKKYVFNDKMIFDLHQRKEIVKKGKEYFKFKITEIK